MRSLFKKPLFVAALAAVMAVTASAVMLSSGIIITPDGWAYWEGSVSLLKGLGFTYFGGQSITAFPPLFPFYLSAVQGVFGVSSWSLSLAVVVLAGATAAAWSYLFMSMFKENRLLNWISLLLILFLAAFISARYTMLLSETLFLLILAIIFIIITRASISAAEGSFPFRYIIFLGLADTALLLCRNASLVFLPGIYLASMMIYRQSSWKKMTSLTAIGFFMPLICWLYVTYSLGQLNAHPIVFHGRYSPFEYLGQFVNGLAALVGSRAGAGDAAVLFLVLVILLTLAIMQTGWARQPRLLALMLLTAVVLSGTAGVFILFNITWINDPYDGRFIWYLPVFMAGAIAVLTTWANHYQVKILGISAIVLITFLQVYTIIPGMISHKQSKWGPYVPLNHTIDPDYISSPPIENDAKILVSPPDFDWINRG